MSDRSRDDYFDLDNFDDSFDSRAYRRRQPNRRQSAYSGRSVYRTASARKRRRARNRRRLRNRAIIIGGGVLILALMILVFSSIIRSCSGGKPEVSTETIAQQEAENPATKSEPLGDLSPTYFKTPVIKDNNKNGELIYGIYVWEKQGFELFGGSAERSKAYADTVNSLADKLPDVNIYNILVPNHTEFGLPQRIKDAVVSESQAESIKACYAGLNDKVTPINPYNYLADHNQEYIYFKSDHHWTGLGAYYGYKAFADRLKLPALSLSDCTEKRIDGFVGSFSNTVDGLDTDSVQYWQLPYDVTMDVTDQEGGTYTIYSPYYEDTEPGPYTYSLFIVGDNALTVMKSQSENTQKGKKLAIIKESYGNAIAPYFTNNYEEVHVVDFRYFRDVIGTDFASYCSENGITDVLIINGVMSANTQIQLDSMSGLVN